MKEPVLSSGFDSFFISMKTMALLTREPHHQPFTHTFYSGIIFHFKKRHKRHIFTYGTLKCYLMFCWTVLKPLGQGNLLNNFAGEGVNHQRILMICEHEIFYF